MNLLEAVVSVAASLFGSLIAVLVVLSMERARRPTLRFDVGQSHEIPQNDPLNREPCKWLRVTVKNDPTPWWIRRIYDRFPAYGCRARLTFHHLDGRPIYDPVMEGRWTNTAEPTRRIIVLTLETTTPTEYVHFDMLSVQRQVDIAPGREELLDVAIRFAGDGESYGFNSESYEHRWRHPQWRLPTGRVLVRVLVDTGGRIFSNVFEIANDVAYADFRLLRPTNVPPSLSSR